MLEHLHGASFDWLHWQNGSIIDFGFPCREPFIIANRDTIRKHAIGYCKGEELVCRPKINHMAVMYLYEDRYFWSHLTNKEFYIIFMNDELSP